MSLLKALINPVTPFEQNAPIIYCENTKNVMDIFKLFIQDLKVNPVQKNSDLQNYFYNFLYSQICE